MYNVYAGAEEKIAVGWKKGMSSGMKCGGREANNRRFSGVVSRRPYPECRERGELA